jgi:carbon monoxide dehydrogenase subunit G
MDLSGSQKFNVPPQQVWNALLNPDMLKQSIPGAQSVTITGNKIDILINVSLPMFSGEVTLSPIIEQQTPPSHAVLAIDYASNVSTLKGNVTIDLQPDGSGTNLTYEAHVKLGGAIGIADNPIGKAAVQASLNHFFKNLESKI